MKTSGLNEACFRPEINYRVGSQRFTKQQSSPGLKISAIWTLLGYKNRKIPYRAFCKGFQRRRRDSNPRNVAVQQFSRLPPSTTRPHLQYFADAKIKIKSFPPKIISLTSLSFPHAHRSSRKTCTGRRSGTRPRQLRNCQRN